MWKRVCKQRNMEIEVLQLILFHDNLKTQHNVNAKEQK